MKQIKLESIKEQKRFHPIINFAMILKQAMKDLAKNDPLRMAGATAFFTTFALPPILIIIIALLGVFFDSRAISGQLFQALAAIIKKESVFEVVRTLTALQKLAQSWFVSIGGFLFLLFVATTLFKVIKNSLNQLWRIRVVKKRSLAIIFRTRLQSIFIILIAGVLFLPVVIVHSAEVLLSKQMHAWSPTFTHYFINSLNFIFSVLIVMVWFAFIFRFLPDGRPVWKVAFTGAFLTSILFNIGKLFLRWVLTYSNIQLVYGASGSIILLLLFVFYSSLILYYGASFTKIWGAYHDNPIKPLPHAREYKITEASNP